MKVKVDDKLAVNKYAVDERHHIKVEQARLDPKTLQALLMACPAGLYTLNPSGELKFEHAGCLECGTCRVICATCPEALSWEYPRATKGVFYRYG